MIWFNEYKPVDGFTIYGLYVGMPENEAKDSLEKNGFTYQDEVYAINTNDFYLTFEEENGNIGRISYTKCFQRWD